MKIKYAGPRAVISQHGIEFKDGKEDKYVYLIIGIQILQAIDKDYGENKSYSYDLHTKRVEDEEMLSIMTKYEPKLEDEIMREIKDYEEHITQDIQSVKNNKIISDIEKDVWIRNIELMREYRVQRAINKIYYMHCINNIKNIIMRENIKVIDTPFYEKYWHVLQTIQGSLEEGRRSLKTVLQVQSKADGIMAKLNIGV